MDTLCTGCRYCEGCPKGIQIPKYMLAYNDSILGKPKDTLGTLRVHWNIPAEKVNDCIECGACEKKCTQHLPIINRLKEIGKWHAEFKR